mgnify:CR=1 FL=1
MRSPKVNRSWLGPHAPGTNWFAAQRSAATERLKKSGEGLRPAVSFLSRTVLLDTTVSPPASLVDDLLSRFERRAGTSAWHRNLTRYREQSEASYLPEASSMTGKNAGVDQAGRDDIGERLGPKATSSPRVR